MKINVLFDRRCRVVIANPVQGNFGAFEKTTLTEISGGKDAKGNIGLRVQFEIQKSLEKTPNTAKVVITNLNRDNRATLERSANLKVLLEAGYKDGVHRLFVGDARTVDNVRNGPDWETTIKIGDGETAWKYAQVLESWQPGTKIVDVVKGVARAMKLETGNVDRIMAPYQFVFDQGWSAAGNAARALDQVLSSIRRRWSIQDGRLQLLKDDGTNGATGTVPEISPESGLVGSAETGGPKRKGGERSIRFTTLLRAITPGDKIKLRCEKLDGYVIAQRISHRGDTAGGEWYTTIDAVIV